MRLYMFTPKLCKTQLLKRSVDYGRAPWFDIINMNVAIVGNTQTLRNSFPKRYTILAYHRTCGHIVAQHCKQNWSYASSIIFDSPWLSSVVQLSRRSIVVMRVQVAPPFCNNGSSNSLSFDLCIFRALDKGAAKSHFQNSVSHVTASHGMVDVHQDSAVLRQVSVDCWLPTLKEFCQLFLIRRCTAWRPCLHAPWRFWPMKSSRSGHHESWSTFVQIRFVFEWW